MAFNLVDTVKGSISDRMLDRIGNAVGTDGTQTSIAMSGALPGLLGGLAGVADRPGGASALLDGVRGADDSLLRDAGPMLDDGRDSQLAERGGSLLSSLLGPDAAGKLAGALGSFTGLGRDKGGSMLGMLAPVVVGALKDKIAGDGLDANGLQSMMSSQRSNIDAAMPDGFADSLRSEGFFDSIGAGARSAPAAPAASTPPPAPSPAPSPTPAAAPAAAGTTSTAAPAPRAVESHAAPAGNASSGGGLPKWLLPVAAVVVLAALALFLLGGDDDVDDEAVVAVTDTTDGVAATGAATAVTAGESAGLSAEAMAAADAALPDGVTMDGLNEQLDTIFTSTTGALQDVTDEASAEAALPALQDASDKLNNFDGLFRRLPAAAQDPVRQIVQTSETSLRPVADTALKVPGAGDVLGPVLNPMLETLAGITGD